MIKGKDCNKMVGIYVKAKAANYQVGEAAKVVATAGDAIQKQIKLCKDSGQKNCDITNLNLMYQSALVLYQKSATDFMNLFNDLVVLAKQLGVISGGK
jgi:hypothetical protein